MICGINSGKGKIDLVSNMIFLIGFQLNLIHNDTGLNGNGFPFFEAESVIDFGTENSNRTIAYQIHIFVEKRFPTSMM